MLGRIRLAPWRLKLAAIAGLIIVTGLLYGLNLLSPVTRNPDVEIKRVVIPAGMTARQIAQLLEEEGIIKSSSAFHILSRLTSASGRMQAGVYDMAPNEAPKHLLERLYSGDTVDLAVRVTIPEGYTIKQIAQVLAEKQIVGQEEFLDYVKSAPLPYDFLEAAVAEREPERRLEGYLFPDTYHFVPGSSAAEVVQAMTNRFKQVIEPLLPAEVLQGGQLTDLPVPLTLDQIIILASIVEKEAVVDGERPTIAGVFYNRLQINQRLQSCATVQYILEKPKPILSDAEMAIDSPYNTYVNDGLPIGPVANPGGASIRAVLDPEDTPYYYFVAKEDGSGEHVFSKTFAEHQAAIRSIRQSK
ncbi:MAG: endolytic transglycosylase MltG [Firmicutes bacterium]|nr:endolytic transglycosylase MltG [Bacillota bacterium]